MTGCGLLQTALMLLSLPAAHSVVTSARLAVMDARRADLGSVSPCRCGR